MTISERRGVPNKMATFYRKLYKIADLLRLSARDNLVLQPKFQRRLAWEEVARSYLIDTVVRGLPMPKIYLRGVVASSAQFQYEVVDGQQRLKAIIDFYNGKLRLDLKHHSKFGGLTFIDLPEPVQAAFLNYEISAEVMEEASDPEVWAMFERLNTYTLVLNRQEKLNARWFGWFKQTAYKLAAEESSLEAWETMKTFSSRQIARMKEVELTSDVLVAIVRGISDISMISKLYKEYDDDFPNREAVERVFRNALRSIQDEMGSIVRSTRFRRTAWFYSLMVAACDVLEGIPAGMGPGTLQPGESVCSRMRDLDEVLKVLEPPEGLSELHSTLSRATSHVRERWIRHEHFYNLLTLPDEAWNRRWQELGGANVIERIRLF